MTIVCNERINSYKNHHRLIKQREMIIFHSFSWTTCWRDWLSDLSQFIWWLFWLQSNSSRSYRTRLTSWLFSITFLCWNFFPFYLFMHFWWIWWLSSLCYMYILLCFIFMPNLGQLVDLQELFIVLSKVAHYVFDITFSGVNCEKFRNMNVLYKMFDSTKCKLCIWICYTLLVSLNMV